MTHPPTEDRREPDALEAPRPHATAIIQDGDDGYISAHCCCGWNGPRRLSDAAARQDGSLHLRTRTTEEER